MTIIFVVWVKEMKRVAESYFFLKREWRFPTSEIELAIDFSQ